MTEPVVVGVDLGSSGARVVALSGDGTVRAFSHEPFPEAAAWPAGRADPAAWLDGLGRVLAALHGTDSDIAALGIGGQSPTTVPMGQGLAVTCRHPVGSGLALRDQHLAQRELLEREQGRPVVGAQIWDWALRRLGAATRQGLWPGEDPLPGYGDPATVGSIVGYCDGALGLRPGVPLVCASNDAYMSFWAGGLGVPGRGHDPGGRTGGLGVAVAAADRPAELFGIAGIVRGVEIVGGPANGHGEVLEWCSRLLGRPIPELLARASDVPPGSRGLLVLPYHDGERAPRWDPRLRGEIAGLSFATGPAELTRAVLESTAFGLRHINEELKTAGVTMEMLGCGGTPARSRLWCAIKASVLEVPVEVPENPEQLSAHGCALAAGAALGWWPGVGSDDMSSWPLVSMSRIEPAPTEAYRAGYQRFVAAGDAAADRLACR